MDIPGSKHSLAEVAWTGYVKDKVALDRFYNATLEKLSNAGLLAQDQSSKTEQIVCLLWFRCAHKSLIRAAIAVAN